MYGCIIIEIEEIMASAFVNAIEKTGTRVLKNSKIEEYGGKVVDQLIREKKKARLNLSREADEDFFIRYSNWFKRTTINGALYIVVDKSVTSMDLFKKFLTPMSLDVLSVFQDLNNVQVLIE